MTKDMDNLIETEICRACEKGELETHGLWRRHKTPFSHRLCSEKPIKGIIYKCTNEDCEEFFYDDEEDQELKPGYPC